MVVLDLYSFEHDAIGVGSAVRADPPDVDRPEGRKVSQMSYMMYIIKTNNEMMHVCMVQ